MFKKISISMVIVIMLAGLMAGVVSAKSSTAGKSGTNLDPRHSMLVGQIQEISNSEFTVEDLNGEIHIITVTDETIFRARPDRELEEADFNDLEVGKYVGVVKHNHSSGDFSARLVVLLPDDFDPSQLNLIRVAGEVSMVSTGAGFFKLDTLSGEKLTISVDENTRFVGRIDSLEDLEKGMKLSVVARKQEDGSLLAKAILTKKLLGEHFTRTAGTLTSISGETITITDRRENGHTFTITDETRFADRSGEVEGLEDLETGMVLVIVHLRETGENEAKAVLVADEALLSLKRTSGVIKLINKNQLTLDAIGSVMHFEINENTRINGLNVSSLDDLQKDMRVLVLYQEDESGKLIAKSISGIKRPPRD
jgi:hypothetical protein